MTAGGLADVGNLLRLINASPFDETPVFRSAIERPFYESVEAAAAALSTAGAARPGSTSAPAADSDDEAFPVGELDSLGAEGDCMLVDGWLQAAGAAGGAAEAAQTPAAAGDQAPVLTALAKALAPRYRRRDGVRRLLALLQPLMWRTSKAVADLDHPLPPRYGRCARRPSWGVAGHIAVPNWHAVRVVRHQACSECFDSWHVGGCLAITLLECRCPNSTRPASMAQTDAMECRSVLSAAFP